MISPAPPLWLCAHETGHALAHLVINDRLPRRETRVVDVTVNATCGLVRVRTSKGADPRNTAIRCLAGYAAENRYRHGAAWQPSDDDFADFAHLTDMRHAAAAIATLPRADPVAEMRTAWDAAYAIIEAEWRPLLRVAEALQRRRTMTGLDVAIEWRLARSNVAGNKSFDIQVHQVRI